MSGNRKELLQAIYDRLLAVFGPQRWWPAETPFEVILGAILTQNTAWKNVATAIGNLRRYDLLRFDSVCGLSTHELATLIRSSGFYNEKAKKIKSFCNHILTKWGGDFEEFLTQETEALRTDLLGIRGIGPETADSIVLYAAFKPSFVVDTYTYRIFYRHGWVDESISYEELREYFMGALDSDVPLFQEFHALLVRTGHLYCRKKPLCESCALSVFFEQ
ncbi:MAG: endonuclease III domain-containing protein [Syntrophobacteraceae bacterium]